MENAFTAVFEKVGDWYIGYVQELPGANTQGRTMEETRENLREAIELVLAANRDLAERELAGRNVVREEIRVRKVRTMPLLNRLYRKMRMWMAWQDYRTPRRGPDRHDTYESKFGTKDHMRATVQGSAILIIAVLFGSMPSAADALSEIPAGVERYARDMEVVVKSTGPVSLESVFEEGISAANALTGGELERLDKPTYQKVRGMMVGFTISREEAIIAAPVADFFLKLARAKGTSVDRAFFEALQRTYPDGAWPTYIRAQTDFGGCTVFDGKTLTEVYGTWIAFQDAQPGRYQKATQKELAGVERALESTCACGGEDGVRSETEAFLKAYPTSPLAAGVAARLEALKNHTSGIRFNCKAR